MKFFKALAWTLWLFSIVEVFAVNIYFREVYPKEFQSKVDQECGQLRAEMNDYANAYEQTADKLNECNKTVVVRTELLYKDINSSADDEADQVTMTTPETKEINGKIVKKEIKPREDVEEPEQNSPPPSTIKDNDNESDENNYNSTINPNNIDADTFDPNSKE